MALLGLISDTHNDLEGFRQGLDIFAENKVERVIHAGDWITPETVIWAQNYAASKQLSLGGVMGNNDTELKTLLENEANPAPQVDLYPKSVMEFTAAGKKIAVYHGDDQKVLASLIKNPDYPVIITGHTHRTRNETVEKTRVINPGSAAFRMRRKSHPDATIAVFDPANLEVRFIVLEK